MVEAEAVVAEEAEASLFYLDWPEQKPLYLKLQ
jgi:hypothetical protein